MSRTEVLTDEMWAQIEPLLPPLKGRMGRPRAPYRPLIEGAIFRLRTGVAWRDLPAEFGPWPDGVKAPVRILQGRHVRQGVDGAAGRC